MLLLFNLQEHSKDCADVDESQIQLYVRGDLIDSSKLIIESGIIYDDEIDVIITPKEENKVVSSVLLFIFHYFMQIVHVVSCYDDKECDVDLTAMDSLKSLFSFCIVLSIEFYLLDRMLLNTIPLLVFWLILID